MTLWLAGMVFQLVLVIVLLVRRLWERFPIFFAYTVFSFFVTVVMYLIRGSPKIYFDVYWTCEALGLLIGLSVVYEVFRQLLIPYRALHKLSVVFMLSAIMLLIAASCGVAYLQHSGETNALMAATLVGEEATRVLEIGLLIFLFAFSTGFGLHWRHQAFGITLGLALFVAVELIGVTTRTRMGPVAAQIFALLRMVSFDVSLLIWIAYSIIPERVESASVLPQSAQLEQWNRAVMELIHQ